MGVELYGSWVKKMLGYFVVQRRVGSASKICVKRSMYLFRERGVEIVVVRLGNSHDQ